MHHTISPKKSNKLDASPRSWEDINAVGLKWFVNSAKGIYILTYEMQAGVLEARQYSRKGLDSIHPELHATLLILEASGATQEEFMGGLKHTWSLNSAHQDHLLDTAASKAGYFFVRWRAIYVTADMPDYYVLRTTDYQVLESTKPCWRVASPRFDDNEHHVLISELNARFPLLGQAFSVTEALDLSRKEAAEYCMEQLGLTGRTEPNVVILPELVA